MTAVLKTRASQADVGAFAAGSTIGLPLEHGEGSSTNFAFFAIILLDHLYERIVGEAVFTHGWEVSGFPAGAIEILFDLWGHIGGFV